MPVIEVAARNIPDTGATLGEVLDLKECAGSFEQVPLIDMQSPGSDLPGFGRFCRMLPTPSQGQHRVANPRFAICTRVPRFLFGREWMARIPG